SQDCPPEFGGGRFNGALAVELNPLTTGSSSVTNISGTGSGNFCAGQLNNGAFGQGSTQCITETGMAAGNLTYGAPHAAREGVVFCIPATGNGTVNAVVDLPGPGATSLPGIAQVVPTPYRSCPCDPRRPSAAGGPAPGRRTRPPPAPRPAPLSVR